MLRQQGHRFLGVREVRLHEWFLRQDARRGLGQGLDASLRPAPAAQHVPQRAWRSVCLDGARVGMRTRDTVALPHQRRDD
eukprot:CAMPEP_0182847590 /NCGR_PEP_ID=MMETSP0006_2-20121128/28541_1 /TAXON_ID=97485 /ORGANISM="Prymnesium parvum, Strain Texoma1" /LENGTH=79 /DNA_ID=CAMNT_0024977937 /DNA_START=572 /DNA_END=811 /DNA_ORIENTATION=+